MNIKHNLQTEINQNRNYKKQFHKSKLNVLQMLTIVFPFQGGSYQCHKIR